MELAEYEPEKKKLYNNNNKRVQCKLNILMESNFSNGTLQKSNGQQIHWWHVLCER